MQTVPSELPFDHLTAEREVLEIGEREERDAARPRTSTLIEFPGVSRTVPEWRKQLSQRVREVQERKAREALEAAALGQEDGTPYALPLTQLELVPEIEQLPRNPIVIKALARVERARRTDISTGLTANAAARALAPVTDAPPETPDTNPKPEAKTKLVAVPAVETKSEAREAKPEDKSGEADRKPVRLISDNPDDAALSYLETYLSVPAFASDSLTDSAPIWRRMIAGILDLLFLTLLAAPFAAGIEFADGNWFDPRIAGLMGGIALVLLFGYLTISIALTGRTFGMRLLSLRTIDARNGMIPTGGQSIKRAFGYTLSLTLFGLGLIYALIDPDRRTFHDRFSKTLVVRN